MLTYHIITIFPNIFSSYFNESILKRAQKAKQIEIKIYNLRDWTSDNHKTVDDTPYGGGAGMVMKIEPLYKALIDIKKDILKTSPKAKLKTIVFSAKGTTWTQSLSKKYTKYTDIMMICGRYEGIDERIMNFVDEEVSIGSYVLTGGEIPAMVLVDSISRLMPGVLGNDDSALVESHSQKNILEYPQYTRPEVFIDDDGQELKVPGVLLSGNHKEIEGWKKNHSPIKTE